MLVAVAVYVRVRWKRAPAAFRAMEMLGIVSVLAGVAIGYSAGHLLSTVDIRPPWKSAKTAAPNPTVTDGKVPSLEVGKAIVLMDEEHSGDPMSVSSGSFVDT